jgi:hypothetical protein
MILRGASDLWVGTFVFRLAVSASRLPVNRINHRGRRARRENTFPISVCSVPSVVNVSASLVYLESKAHAKTRSSNPIIGVWS